MDDINQKNSTQYFLFHFQYLYGKIVMKQILNFFVHLYYLVHGVEIKAVSSTGAHYYRYSFSAQLRAKRTIFTNSNFFTPTVDRFLKIPSTQVT